MTYMTSDQAVKSESAASQWKHLELEQLRKNRDADLKKYGQETYSIYKPQKQSTKTVYESQGRLFRRYYNKGIKIWKSKNKKIDQKMIKKSKQAKG